jgi:hypothetical protein
MKHKTFADLPPEERAEAEASLARISAARQAIVDKIGPYERGKSWSALGTIPCPNCEGGTLHYSRSSYNGHIHGQCTTPDCTWWME